MSASVDLQDAIERMLTSPRTVDGSGNPCNEAALPCPVLRRRPKNPQSDLEEEIEKQQLAAIIIPPLATSAMQGVPFVFFDGYEVRVRVVEQPAMNDMEADAYEVSEQIALLLQWAMPTFEGVPMLAHPLEIAARPMEMIEDPRFRIIDVIFKAVLQINLPPAN